MGKFRLKIKRGAQKELKKHYRSGDQPRIKKIEKILDELSKHPESGIGKPEKLKHELVGYWSRRINRKDRIVYSIQHEKVTVEVVSAMGHYGES